MDADTEQMVRDVLAGEQFGVLATAAEGRLHTSTILFAESARWELVFAIRPATLKARLSAIVPAVAFQVDNRAITADNRAAFVRIGFEGMLHRVPRDDPDWTHWRDLYAAKLPFGAALLDNPEVELYVLATRRLRVAAGAGPAVDIELPPPQPLSPDESSAAVSADYAP